MSVLFLETPLLAVVNFVSTASNCDLLTASSSAVPNNYPYSANNKSEFLTIALDGHYQIIYTDFYRSGNKFIIHDDTNGNDLFVTNLGISRSGRPITINAVIPIKVDNGFGYVRTKIYTQTSKSALYGDGFSTLYIKNLHA